MAPNILIVGAIGNTGRSAVSTLSDFTQKPNHHLASYGLLAQTRSASSDVAKQLASVPNLRESKVTKVFIASHVGLIVFSEESHFLVAALNGGVKQIAIETMLDTKEFKGIMWTSLQSNVFTSMVLANAIALVKEYRKTGKQQPLSLISPKDVSVGIIDPNNVGAFVAYVLASKNPEVHNGKRYILNGPKDISGQGIIDLIEKEIRAKVKNVIYKDLSWLNHAAQGPQKVLTLSIKYVVETSWEGKCRTKTTSKEVFGIRAPKTTPAQAFKEYLEG